MYIFIKYDVEIKSMGITQRLSYKKQELLTLRDHLVYRMLSTVSVLAISDCPFVLSVSQYCPFLIGPSCCQCLCIVHFWLPLRVVSVSVLSISDCPFVLSVSLHCPFLIGPSCCQCLCIVHFWLPLRFSLTFIHYLIICNNFL